MEKVEDLLLDGNCRYSGTGYYENSKFIPNGLGKMQFPNYYAKGNFVDGVLSGPAIISHDYYMNTVFMKNDRGNGWGMCINRGVLAEFGYYQNSQLKTDLTDAVDWYYHKMQMRPGQGSMLHFYTSKTDGHLTEILIGWPGGASLGNGMASVYVGFHFLEDGSVWIGNTATIKQSGTIVKFTADGFVQIGEFENGRLVNPMDIQDVIDAYYGTDRNADKSPIAAYFAAKMKKEFGVSERENVRHKFDNVTVDTNKNYFK